ncbi:hypothetical protein ACFC1G_10860 [Streptomyces sp. NPDC056085]|uniref:hypothetical protein n=1 Tax=Streptomyces sp. NPDC056085 TaxID=3345708 RepID=UPI0035E162D2
MTQQLCAARQDDVTTSKGKTAPSAMLLTVASDVRRTEADSRQVFEHHDRDAPK